MSIREEIEKATKTEQGKKEKMADYLERLIDEVNDEDEGLTDKQFNKLSKDTQGWLNKGAAALDKNKPVPAFPDAEEDEEEDDKPAAKKKGKKGKKAKDEDEEEEDEEEEEDDKPAAKKDKKGKKGKKSKDAEPEDEEEEEDEKPAKKEKKSAAKKEKKDKKPSAISRMQYFCCKHPKMDKVKIGEKVRKEGYEFSDSTLSIQFGQAHKIMAILADLAG